MEFFRIRRDIPFMRYAVVLNVISAVTFAAAVFFIASRYQRGPPGSRMLNTRVRVLLAALSRDHRRLVVTHSSANPTVAIVATV